MILNSDPTAKPIMVTGKVGNPSTVPPSLNNLKTKVLNWKPSKTMWVFMIGSVVVMIVERKLNLKPKKFNFSYGGKK